LGLGQTIVRRVSDQEVPEPERLAAVVATTFWPDELLAHERHQLPAHGCSAVLRRELGHLALAELLADHRRALDRPPLWVAEPIETRSEQRLDRRRDRDRVELADLQGSVRAPPDMAVIEEHPDDLLDEERIPVRRNGNASTSRLGD